MSKSRFRSGFILLVMLTIILTPFFSNAASPAYANSSAAAKTTAITKSAATTKLQASPASLPSQPVQKWDKTAYDRPEQYSSYTTLKDVKITMRDGINLYANIYIPNGKGTFPVILTQTPYNKNTTSLGLYPNEYLIKRGYVQMVVDVRGTGSSQGAWDAFGLAEQQDGKELVEWAAKQPWSDGKVGLYGPSYMGINQFFTAAQHPNGLKAIFPIVPAGDIYRDLAMSGGLPNTAFMPLWYSLTIGQGLQLPNYAMTDPIQAASALLTHAGAATNFPATSLTSRRP